MNSVKVEHPAYYCNSYPDQGPTVADRSASVDSMVVSAAYCKFPFASFAPFRLCRKINSETAAIRFAAVETAYNMTLERNTADAL